MHTDTWRVQKQGQYSSAVVLRGTEEAGDLEIVAKAYGIEGHSDEAIACLIAAAPEMLLCLQAVSAALQELDDDWRGMNATLVDQIIATNRYAVAGCLMRAEGRSE